MAITIFTKETRTTDTGKQYQVRLFGENHWIPRDEFEKLVRTNQLYFKANKPLFENDLNKF